MSEENSKVLSASSLSKKSKEDYLSELKRQRGHLKGRLTQFKKYIDSFQGAILTKLQVSEMKLRLQTVSEYFNKLNTIASEIEINCSEEDIVNHLEYFESIESLYFSATASASCLIESFETSDSSKHEICCHTIKENRTLLNVKLPEIKLPTFDGSYDHWLEFRNSYETMIHKRSDLDAIHKFHYLRSSLIGTALQVISALEFTACNYTHAWELLENRFHNHRLLVHNHIKSLFNIPCIKQESASQIRKLIDTVLRNLRALKSLNEPTESWDTLIIYLVVTKLDPNTDREWENHKGSLMSQSNRLQLDDLIICLKNRADTLEMINTTHPKPQIKFIQSNLNENKNNKVYSYVSTSSGSSSKHLSNKDSSSHQTKLKRNCIMCNNNHKLFTCIKFLNLSINDRIKLVNDHKLCPNCLRGGHSVDNCIFGPCQQCKRKHNSLLHLNELSGGSSNTNACVPACAPTFTAMHSLVDCSDAITNNTDSSSASYEKVLLSTALVEVAGQNKRFHVVRALLDNGSQHSLITKKLAKRLNTNFIQSTVSIAGVGHNLTQSNKSCVISMRSKTSDFNKRISCLVLPQITSSLPSTNLTYEQLKIPDNIRLADPTFDVSAEIDLLIGADTFWDLLEQDRIRLPTGPFLLNTKLGWVISGPVHSNNLKIRHVQCNFSHSLDLQLRKFWEIEELPQSSHILTADERKCEELFTNSTRRDINGRFSVRIPLRESADLLGDSYTIANKRFLALERKLDRSPLLKKMYCDFMKEYEVLGHMSRVENYTTPNFFLPHHGVYKESSTTTKLRVVFDGSTKTLSQKSLNDIQLPGPALQNDIFAILLRFRQYRYVACADIEKLFRQVLIQPDQRSLQYILWRENPTDALGIYQLNTVTYGTASAPYLSMRCIRQLALESDDDVIARVIKEDMFVDDLITGHDDYDVLLDICEKTLQVLNSGCFPLRKWTFNFDPIRNNKERFNDGLAQSKTLGLGWFNDSDQFHFTSKININFDKYNLTKRMMLSVISQIYDPLGILGPAVIIPKILLQKLWLSKIDWDTPVSREIAVTWSNFMKTLTHLNELRIPRQVRSMFTQFTELHIYTDASQSAYGACAYIRTYNTNSEITVRLLCAKSRVAPLKTISVPRLELCGALLGARLYKKIINSLKLSYTKVYFWTDSTIVMGWIRMSPHLLKTFVQNRVTELNELTGDAVWLHVNSKDNPADLLSRGLHLDSLIHCQMWWTGPSYLYDHNFIHYTNKNNSNNNFENNELPDIRNTTLIHTSTLNSPLFNFENYSSFNKLKRVCAYVLRFAYNIRMKRVRGINRTGLLSVDELNEAQRLLVRISQMQTFADVYHCLLNKLPMGNKIAKRVLGLNVFLDEHNIIRVGGRLSNSTSFRYDKRHPILLCGKHRFSLLLFRYEHLRLLHASPLLLLANIRECWWPLGARNLAKRVVRECVTCTRYKGKTLSPIMGNLPNERLDPGFPFIRTGVDYAGPVYILNKKGRGARLTKCYIALFVCFLTRAIHLELVTSLTTKDYILALKRFMSRRGKPDIIISDNGRNFIGAEKELPVFFRQNSNDIIESLSIDGIKLKFIPPYSPHWGGLWESGVRSCKYHLRRIVGNARLTYEEFSTVLTQIEAVLNSRPLSPMSTDPHDFSPLTPAHFLIGRSLAAPAHEDLTSATTSQLTRYHRIEQMRQHFWQRWSKEYVAEMQTRTKWKTNKGDVGVDSLVLIKDDNLPPLKWKLGRVIQVFPGKDGVSRVADVRTASGVVRRSFSKISPLPQQSENL